MDEIHDVGPDHLGADGHRAADRAARHDVVADDPRGDVRPQTVGAGAAEIDDEQIAARDPRDVGQGATSCGREGRDGRVDRPGIGLGSSSACRSAPASAARRWGCPPDRRGERRSACRATVPRTRYRRMAGSSLVSSAVGGLRRIRPAAGPHRRRGPMVTNQPNPSVRALGPIDIQGSPIC